jgi:hypothetical protein
MYQQGYGQIPKSAWSLVSDNDSRQHPSNVLVVVRATLCISCSVVVWAVCAQGMAFAMAMQVVRNARCNLRSTLHVA